MEKVECKNHKWDKETGEKTKSKPWAGLRSRCERTCIECGKVEEWNTGPVFFGWYSR